MAAFFKLPSLVSAAVPDVALPAVPLTGASRNQPKGNGTNAKVQPQCICEAKYDQARAVQLSLDLLCKDRKTQKHGLEASWSASSHNSRRN